MTTPDNWTLRHLCELNLQALPHSSSFPFFLDPFNLRIDKIIRFIPQKRMVISGYWESRPVIAKIFFHTKQAKTHSDKELSGIALLTQHRIPTAHLYACCVSPDQRIIALLFEPLTQAQPLEERLRTSNNIVTTCTPLMAELATQHILGIIQQDLHLKNFLIEGNKIYTLDGGAIIKTSSSVSKKQEIKRLSLLLSQLAINTAHHEHHLLKVYAKYRGWKLYPRDLYFLKTFVDRWRQQRWKQFRKKILKTTTHFLAIRHRPYFSILCKSDLSPTFIQLCMHPEDLLQDHNTLFLKKGRTATVVQIQVDQYLFVVKRYNAQHHYAQLRYYFKATRALYAWHIAHQLTFLGIPTANPVACIQERQTFLPGPSYFIMEYVPGLPLDRYLEQHENNLERIDAVINQLAELCVCLAQARLTQHDWKANNIMITPSLQPVLIDIDGISQRTIQTTFKYAWKRHMKRLLSNFPLFLQEKLVYYLNQHLASSFLPPFS